MFKYRHTKYPSIYWAGSNLGLRGKSPPETRHGDTEIYVLWDVRSCIMVNIYRR